jgi:hypothetical protein
MGGPKTATGVCRNLIASLNEYSLQHYTNMACQLHLSANGFLPMQQERFRIQKNPPAGGCKIINFSYCNA